VSLGKDAKDIKAAHVWLWACVCISGLGPDETETPPPHTSRKRKGGKAVRKLEATGTVHSFQIHTPGTQINESK